MSYEAGFSKAVRSWQPRPWVSGLTSPTYGLLFTSVFLDPFVTLSRRVAGLVGMANRAAQLSSFAGAELRGKIYPDREKGG